MKPPRIPLFKFPDVVVHAEETETKRHSKFAAAKGGDVRAARSLVAELVRTDTIEAVRSLLKGGDARFLPIHALEVEGVNEIPAALARAVLLLGRLS